MNDRLWVLEYAEPLNYKALVRGTTIIMYILPAESKVNVFPNAGKDENKDLYRYFCSTPDLFLLEYGQDIFDFFKQAESCSYFMLGSHSCSCLEEAVNMATKAYKE